METLVKNNSIEYTYNKYKIKEKIEKTIDIIEKIVKENNYQVVGKIENYYEFEWKNLSKSQMKKIQKYCFWIEKNPTLKRINTFLSILSRFFGIDRVHIKISLKEEKIQKARKEWLKARNEADKLLGIYKEEKGDFYKKINLNFFLNK